MDPQLRRLAEHAGIMVDWHDYRGEPRQVEPEVVRAVLAALGYHCTSERSCAEALARAEAEHRQQPPALLVAEVGQSIALPPALAMDGGERARLAPEEGDGEPFHLAIDRDGDRAWCRPAPDRPGYYRLEVGKRATRLALAPRRCCGVAEAVGRARGWGVAAQLYSLTRHGDGGIGDFTALAELGRRLGTEGADALAISPVHALFAADANHYSPYSPSSRLFLNPLHVDLRAALAEADLSPESALPGAEAELARLERLELVEWPAAAELRLKLLRRAWERQAPALLAGEGAAGQRFQTFRQARGDALERHALFETIHADRFGRDPGSWHWRDWPDPWRNPESAEVQAFGRDRPLEIGFHIYLQWLAERGLAAAQRAARDSGMGIGLVADLAVGTDTGGSHAWSHQRDMLIGLTVGAPPDLINVHGQNWGLVTFSPRGLRRHGYQPFIDMLRALLRHTRGLRIDHILGLSRLWVIPEGFEDGAYLRYPLEDLLKLIALESWRHGAVVCGEDLGTVPPGLREALAEEGILGMRVLWFERDHGLFVAPKRWSDRAMAVTTTHDLPTVAGWWSERDIDWRADQGLLAEDSDEVRERHQRAVDRQVLWSAFEYAGTAAGPAPPRQEPQTAVDAALRFIARTPAPLAMAPLEDMLGLVEQPNLPGTVDQHPNWRRRLAAPASELLEEPRVKGRFEAMSRLRKQAHPEHRKS